MKIKYLFSLAILVISMGCASISPSREPQQLEDIGWKKAEKIISQKLGTYRGTTKEGEPCQLTVWDDPLFLGPNSEKPFHHYGVTYERGEYYERSFEAKSNGGLKGNIFSGSQVVAKIEGNWVKRFMGSGGHSYRHEILFSENNTVTVSTEVNGNNKPEMFCTLRRMK